MPVTFSSDLYAAGVIAYMLLASKHPFELDDASSLMQQTLYDLPDASQMDADPAIREVVIEAAAKNARRTF